jgi:outer membrane protein OmpA-like peptidoglycan-associated protein
MEFFEARNAVRIAESAGAAKYAADSYANAVRLMKQADDLATMKEINKKQLISVSREAVETAEDAREIAVKRMEAERIAAERTAAANAEAAAKAQAAQALRERSEADRQAREARENAQRAQAAQASAEQAAATAQAEAERNRAAAAASEQQLQQAVRDREELRARLLQQFNAILETRDTVRGLVVNLSDVLFDTGKYTLRPGAREKLAKISGILLAYPTLNIAVEGHTDSVGSESYNQELSENRAATVRDYLVSQGVPAASVTARGFGKTQPVASNDTAAGRQQNRRVELIVSGEVIGTVIVAPR